MRRNLLYVRSRIMSACIMSVVLGGLYYQRSVAQGMTLYGTFLNCLMIMGFANLSEMAAAVENKYIAYRHVANGFFPPALYVLTSAITHIPVAVTEVFIFTGVIYGLSGMGPSVGGYFFLWFVVVLFDVLMRNLLVLFALSGKSLQASQAAPLPIIALCVSFARGLDNFRSLASPSARPTRTRDRSDSTPPLTPRLPDTLCKQDDHLWRVFSDEGQDGVARVRVVRRPHFVGIPLAGDK
jgi:hypothetical protein